VRFDCRSGFDAEACAAIESTLPEGAEGDVVLPQLEWAALAYVTQRRDLKQQRKRLERRLKLIDELATDLRPERRHPTVSDDGGAPRRALEALGEIRGQTISALTVYNEQVLARAQSRSSARRALRRNSAGVGRGWRPTSAVNLRSGRPAGALFQGGDERDRRQGTKPRRGSHHCGQTKGRWGVGVL
jgi:hypothetical protein